MKPEPSPPARSPEPNAKLQEALRVARAVRKFEATVRYSDDREPIGDKVRRWQRLRTPDLPDWAQELRAHDPAWISLCEREAARIGTRLGPVVREVQQIGSSAVSHLQSKPILDLLVVVRADPADEELVAPFADLGYDSFGNSPCDREACWFWKTGEKTIFVAHVCDHLNPWVETAINFRDYMREHPSECSRYEKLKRELAERDDRLLLEYSLGKLALFYELSASADAWKKRAQR